MKTKGDKRNNILLGGVKSETRRSGFSRRRNVLRPLLRVPSPLVAFGTAGRDRTNYAKDQILVAPESERKVALSGRSEVMYSGKAQNEREQKRGRLPPGGTAAY